MTGPRTAWFHCFAGTAGDMTMASLVHAGADPAEVAAILGGLPLDGYAVGFEPVLRCGIAATLADVAVIGASHHHHDDEHVDEHGHGSHAVHRAYRDIAACARRLDGEGACATGGFDRRGKEFA